MKGRWLLIGLVVSLALNLFLVGLGAGALLFGKGRPGEPAAAGAGQGGQRRGPLWTAGRGLSEQYRPAYRQVLMRATMATRDDLREARRLKRRGFDAMASDNYDPKAVAADFEAARALEFKARTRIERDIADFAATLPKEERSALSESLRMAMTRLVTNRFQQTWEGRQQPLPPPGETAPPPGGE